MVIGTWRMKPECSTSHGARPSAPRTIMASDAPYRARPDEELRQPPAEATGAQLGDGAEVDEGGAQAGAAVVRAHGPSLRQNWPSPR